MLCKDIGEIKAVLLVLPYKKKIGFDNLISVIMFWREWASMKAFPKMKRREANVDLRQTQKGKTRVNEKR